VDTGRSGSAASRPEFGRLLNDARMRRIDAVLVWKLDRWGRSVAATAKSIQELVSLGVRFIAVTQNIDTDDSNPMARFLLHILAAFVSANSFASESSLACVLPKHVRSKSGGRNEFFVATKQFDSERRGRVGVPFLLFSTYLSRR
jgi:hypothetical protein